MTLKRINPLLVEPRYYRGCDCGLVARKAVAQAQLEADQKPYKKLQEKIQVTNVYYLREIQDIRKAHNAVIREIKDWLGEQYNITEEKAHKMGGDAYYLAKSKAFLEAGEQIEQKYLGGKAPPQ